MIDRLVHYTELRRNHLPHSLAWAMSGMKFQAHRIAFWLSTALVIGCCIFLLSDEANSKQPVPDMQYVRSLEKIVSQCLSDSTGKPIEIDGEIYFCGIYKIGERK